jgi:cell division septation protein DedD
MLRGPPPEKRVNGQSIDVERGITHLEVKPMKRATLVSIIVSALVIIGVVVYLARPRSEETDNVPLHQSPAPAQPTPGPAPESGTVPGGTAPSAGAPSALASCVGAMNPQTSISSLVTRRQLANSLLQKKQLDGALTELRNIAALDPGYPAINLDISNVLFKSKHAPEARDAIKSQVDISACLSRLPTTDKLAYCGSQWVAWPEAGCIQELASIEQKAHDGARVIDTELARGDEPRSAPPTGASAAAKQPASVAPRPTVVPTTKTASVVQKSVPESSPEVATAAPPKPPPPVLIKSTEASAHVGQLATVCGDVVDKHTAEQSNGKPTFVNFDHPFPNPSFTVLIWGSDSPAVGDFPATGNVCVTGTIATYRGNPEIVVHDAKSWFRSDEP